LGCKSQIEILASLVHPRDRRPKGFVFIQSYMNESGIHHGAKLCVVAGYYGTKAAWEIFERQWRSVLRNHHIEQVGFHAKRFWKRTKTGERVPPYTGWNDETANRFLERLVQTVLRNRIFPFGYGVVEEDWMRLPLNARRILTGATYRRGRFSSSGSPNRSYYLPFIFSLSASLARSGAAEVAEKVHFFVGLDRTLSGYARDLYRRALEDPRVREPFRNLFGTLSFPLSKDTPQLQAADLLAHRLYSDYMQSLNGSKPTGEITRLLVRNQRQVFELLDTPTLEELLEQYMKQYKAEDRKDLPPLT
jgi:hypothetical protein